MIEFDELKMQQYARAFGEELTDFFNREDVTALLDRNDFQTLFDIWSTFHDGSTGSPLTSALLLSIPEFITQLRWLPSTCFESLPITKVTVPSNIELINDGCFSYCRELTDIDILEGCKQIGDYAFAYCDKLNSLSLPKSITHLGKFIAKESKLLNRIDYHGTIKNWASTKLHWQWDLGSNVHEIKFSDGTTQEI